MHRVTLFLIVLALALSACAAEPAATSAPTEAAQVDEPYPAQVNSQPPPAADPYPAQAEQPAAEQPAAEQPAASASVVTFSIVPQESQVNYEVGETFLDQGNVFATAIGITKGISGDITIDYTNPQNSSIGTITVDISQFTSDSNRRDNAIRDRFLESSRFPLATFTPTSIEGLPAVGEEGVDYPLKITGDLSVKETTKQVTFDATIRLDGDMLTGTATTTILMSDFAVGPISIAGILETQDEVKLIFSFTARPAD